MLNIKVLGKYVGLDHIFVRLQIIPHIIILSFSAE